jgi:hypothetical protein
VNAVSVASFGGHRFEILMPLDVPANGRLNHASLTSELKVSMVHAS